MSLHQMAFPFAGAESAERARRERAAQAKKGAGQLPRRPHQIPIRWRILPILQDGCRSMGTKKITKRERATFVPYPKYIRRPKTRGDCLKMPRPCPFVTCRHHLLLDVNPESGAIWMNHPGVELEELEDTCSLDVADRYEAEGITSEHVGLLIGTTPERARQIDIGARQEVRSKLTGELAVEGSDDDSITDYGSEFYEDETE